MRKRVNGKPDGSGKKCPWLGMELLDKETFIELSLNDPNFQQLWGEWLEAKYSHRGPSVHRIERSKGYTSDNIEWIAHREHSKQHAPNKKAA